MKRALRIVALILVFALLFCSCSREQGGDAAEGAPGAIVVDSARESLNLLTGQSDLPNDRAGWRPFAVCVDNYAGAWPQYGTSKADIIYEIETEGGITRLLCVYADAREIATIGPVRSLRDQFLEVAGPLDAVVVHIGTSIYADEAIARHDYATLDAGVYGSTVWTDTERLESYASEHCKFTGGEAIQKGMGTARLETMSSVEQPAFNFAPAGQTATPGGGAATLVNYIFSTQYSGYYDGDFRYNEASGKYLKYQHGEAQKDAGANNEQLSFTNVFLLFADISRRGTTELVEVDYAAGGTGYYFSEGRYEQITWAKSEFALGFEFTVLSTGEPLEVNHGNSHVGIVNSQFENRLAIE